jgi:hypothetical protein
VLRSEAKAEVINAAGPGHSVCLTVKDWHHANEDGTTFGSLEYQVSVLPGINGQKCSQWQGKSLAAVVADAVADLIDPPVLPTPTELDEQFEEKAVAAAIEQDAEAITDAVDLGATPDRTEADTVDIPIVPMQREPVLAVAAARPARDYTCDPDSIPF